MRSPIRCWTPVICLILLTGNVRSAPQVTFAVQLDLGRDLGQSFGSVFQAQDPAGQVVAGAGFADVYNTRFRTGRRTLQFFLKPPGGSDSAMSLARLPHPDLDGGVYLMEWDKQIAAWSSVGGNSLRTWDADRGSWRHGPPAGLSRLRSGDGAMRLGAGRLVVADNRAVFDGREIFHPDDGARYLNFYYAQGMLCFYRQRDRPPRAGDDSPQLDTELVAFAWQPEEASAVDPDSAIVMRTPYGREVPFAWGQYRDQVLTVSNMGGIYVLENGKWHTALEPDDKVSYQVYSMLAWYDRLLLAHYPSGNLFSWQGEEARQLEDWPPRLPGVSPHARECQTLAIYRGDLWAGVWPWAELWRYDVQHQRWLSMGRAFTHPQPTDQQVHPYESQAARFNLVLNHWGQRITSMIPQQDALMLATSAKGTSPWENRYDFLSEAQRREYGAVLRARLPGNLAVPIRWQDRAIALQFTITPRELVIRQDGKVLASTQHGMEFARIPGKLDVDWGRGPFGPLRGKIQKPRVQRGD